MHQERLVAGPTVRTRDYNMWPIKTEAWSIAVKELIPIVMALILWGQDWNGNVVLIQCDNRAVVDVLTLGFAKDSILLHLLWCVFFISAHF